MAGALGRALALRDSAVAGARLADEGAGARRGWSPWRARRPTTGSSCRSSPRWRTTWRSSGASSTPGVPGARSRTRDAATAASATKTPRASAAPSSSLSKRRAPHRHRESPLPAAARAAGRCAAAPRLVAHRTLLLSGTPSSAARSSSTTPSARNPARPPARAREAYRRAPGACAPSPHRQRVPGRRRRLAAPAGTRPACGARPPPRTARRRGGLSRRRSTPASTAALRRGGARSRELVPSPP